MPYPRKIHLSEVQKLVKEGLTKTEIAKKLGVTRQALWQAQRDQRRIDQALLKREITEVLETLSLQINRKEHPRNYNDRRAMIAAVNLISSLKEKFL